LLCPFRLCLVTDRLCASKLQKLKMSNALREGMVVGLCNPLLDISASAEPAFLEKYGLLANNAILAEEKHKPMYKEMISQYKVDYIAGGSGQNTMRVAQRVMKKPNVSVFMGCVGKDEYSRVLEEKARADGVDVKYQYTEADSTGTCAVLLTNNGANRSLCANLAAANLFTKDHIEVPENRELIEKADYYYITGFFITVCPDAILSIAQHACQKNKLFMMNLSAPFISQFFKDPLMKAMPYVDILFGNETEAQTFATEQNLKGETMSDIAAQIAALPKENKLKSRIVIITQGKDEVIVAQDAKISTFKTSVLSAEQIVDTNGAGDAFVGGFLSQLLQGRSMDKCVACGVWAATEIIQQDGCALPATLEIPEEFKTAN